MAKIISLNDAGASLERDRMAFKLRLTGMSNRQIAEELRCTVSQVEASLVRMMGSVTPELRHRTLQIELERLDVLQSAHFEKAATGDDTATLTTLKIMERRARMLGLDAPARIDVIERALTAKEVNSTERIQQVLDEIAGKTNLMIEGDVIDAEPVPEPVKKDTDD
jgi:hypothetical protein